MADSSSARFSLAFPNFFFTSLSMTLLATLVCPLLCGCFTKVVLCLMPNPSRKSWTPLSKTLISVVGDQSLWNYKPADSDFYCQDMAMGSASIHLVNWFIPTRRYCTCSFGCGKRLSMSTPYTTKGHSAIMLCSSSTGKWEMMPKIWNFFTFLHVFSAIFSHSRPIVPCSKYFSY